MPAAQELTAHFGVEVALANLTRPRVAAALDAGAPREMLPKNVFKHSIAITDKAMGAGIGDMMRQVPPLPTLSPGSSTCSLILGATAMLGRTDLRYHHVKGVQRAGELATAPIG